MRRLLTSVVLFALAAAGAPKSAATTIAVVDCTPTTNGCAAGPSFTLSGDGYSPRKLYIIEGTSPADPEIFQSGVVTPDADGTIEFTNCCLVAGTWTFSVFAANHNGTPSNKELATTTVVFE